MVRMNKMYKCDSELRKLQLLEYEMLKDIAKICDDNEIVYFLTSGTLLGAARHQGFIPWDDDIDICMDVKNYRKFLKIVQKVLPEKYFFQNYRTDSKVGIKWSKIRINGTTSMERDMTNYDIHYGVCMDIFVMSGIAECKFRRFFQCKASKWMSVLLEKYYVLAKKMPISSKLSYVYKIIPDWLRIEIIKWLERISLVNTEKTSYCYNTWYLNFASEKTWKIPSEFCKGSNRIKLKFEDEYFWAPKEYEKCLEIMYGDWRCLPPVSERGGHGDIIVDLKNDYKVYYTGE